MPLAFVVFLLVGLLLYWVLVPRLQGSVNPEMLSIILFFGLSQVIEAITTIFFGTSERSIQSRRARHRVLDHQGQVVRRHSRTAAVRSRSSARAFPRPG